MSQVFLDVGGTVDASGQDLMVGGGFRTGLVGIFSTWLNMDAAYGIFTERVRLRVGADLHLVYYGIQSGILLDVPLQDTPVPGMYFGLSANIPLGAEADRMEWGLVLGAGVNLRFGANELAEGYFRLGVFYGL